MRSPWKALAVGLVLAVVSILGGGFGLLDGTAQAQTGQYFAPPWPYSNSTTAGDRDCDDNGRLPDECARIEHEVSVTSGGGYLRIRAATGRVAYSRELWAWANAGFVHGAYFTPSRSGVYRLTFTYTYNGEAKLKQSGTYKNSVVAGLIVGVRNGQGEVISADSKALFAGGNDREFRDLAENLLRVAGALVGTTVAAIQGNLPGLVKGLIETIRELLSIFRTDVETHPVNGRQQLEVGATLQAGQRYLLFAAVSAAVRAEAERGGRATAGLSLNGQLQLVRIEYLGSSGPQPPTAPSPPPPEPPTSPIQARLTVDRGCGAPYEVGAPIVVTVRVVELPTDAAPFRLLDRLPDGRVQVFNLGTLVEGQTRQIRGRITPPTGWEELELQAFVGGAWWTAATCGFRVVGTGGGGEGSSSLPPPEPERELLFQDDFSDPTSGWTVLENDWGRWQYENGEYSIEAQPGADPGWRWGDAPERVTLPSSLTLEVDARFVGGPFDPYSGYGVILYHPATDDFYTFLLTPNGGYELGKEQGERYIVLAQGTSSAIRRGPGSSWNRIELTVRGTEFRVRVNGQELVRLRDPNPVPIAGGRLILAIYGPGGFHAHFDNVRLWRE